MTILNDPRIPVAREVLDCTFGARAFMNEYLSEKLLEIYDACIGADEDPVHRMGNTIWTSYSGGTTCHNAAAEIVQLWKDNGLV